MTTGETARTLREIRGFFLAAAPGALLVTAGVALRFFPSAVGASFALIIVGVYASLTGIGYLLYRNSNRQRRRLNQLSAELRRVSEAAQKTERQQKVIAEQASDTLRTQYGETAEALASLEKSLRQTQDSLLQSIRSHSDSGREMLQTLNEDVQSALQAHSDGQNSIAEALSTEISQSRDTLQAAVRRHSWRASDWSRTLNRRHNTSGREPGRVHPPSARDTRQLTEAEKVSVRGWPVPPAGIQPLALGVMDEFTQMSFRDDLRLIHPRPDNWSALAKKYAPDLLFIESAWKGNSGSWQYRVGSYAMRPGPEVRELTDWGRKNNVPSIFWNKEDPVHHQKFMEAAKHADHVFTTDANMIPSYVEMTGNSSVHALPFAAQPSLHRPAPLPGRVQKAAFAGSWYGNRHAERGEAMSWLLRAASHHGLDIFDRNYETGIFPFPEELSDHVRGSLPYLDLCREYARYRVFLNVNSVTDSPTMFSRRVFELLASGTPVISTYARGIEEMFGTDVVWMVSSPAEAEEALETLLHDDAEWRRRSLAGIRAVFSQHTYAHRLEFILETIGAERRVEASPDILLFAQATSDQDLNTLAAFHDRQRYGKFTLVVENPAGDSLSNPAENMQVVAPGVSREIFNSAQRTSTTLMGHISAEHHYGPEYLQDLANASLYRPDAAGWGKALRHEDEFSFSGEALSAASLWRSSLFDLEWLHTSEPSALAGVYRTDAEGFIASGGAA